MRARLQAARRALTADEISAARAAVREHLLARAAADGWRVVAAYVPMRAEPGSPELLDELVARGVRVLVPLLLPDRDLDWAEWSSSVAVGSDAIGSCDAVLVPALAVSRTGVRLGRGGGSYDRALPRRRPGATAIALLYDGEMLDEVPAEPWDAPVDAAVTPSGFVRCG